LLVATVSGAAASASPRLPPPTTQAKQAAARPAIAVGPDTLQLLAQPAWVGPGQTEFRVRLKVTASDAADETLVAIIYSALTARSEFQADLGGQVAGAPYYLPTPVPLGSLPSDPGGGVDLDIPVNQAGLGAEFGTGVYPVQIFLEKGGVRVGQPLSLFLVYAGADASHLQRLNVAIVVPLAAWVPINSRTGAVGPVSASTTFWLRADIADLARADSTGLPATQRVPVTLEADDPTVQALASGTPAERRAVSQLKAAVSSGDELLPSTSIPVAVPELIGSHLTPYLQGLLADGSQSLSSILGASPSLGTWAFGSGVDPASASALAAMGAQQIVVPEGDLSPLPAEYQDLTFAQPTKLSAYGADMEVIGADSELSARIGQADARGEAVLVGEQVLSELAMIDLEAPNDVRGVVVLAPPGETMNPTFLSVLLSGLEANPLVQAITLAGEFRTVALASTGPGKSLERSLEGSQVAPAVAGSGQLGPAEDALSADGEVFGPESPLVAGLAQQLVVSLSSDWTAAQRQAMVAAAMVTAQSELAKLRLPPPISITLTSHQGRLPLTVLSDAGVPASVRLLLSSAELSFLPQKFAAGKCLPVSSGSESCELVLAKSTTLQVPVAVRTSGVFQLSLTLETPDGSSVIAARTDTVRSTATNEVALGVMIGAALFLAVWWARNARHGRRAKKLVPRPTEEVDEPAEEGPTAVGPTFPAPGAAAAARAVPAPPPGASGPRRLGPAGGNQA
ncbi:MAG TPA: DUF6049 family protein, partial [Acidimicrobiales bacterium]|nr:DUF6049 family protein [Acidimicrobiales bacterium]